jgi:hypothetical protein
MESEGLKGFGSTLVLSLILINRLIFNHETHFILILYFNLDADFKIKTKLETKVDLKPL